MLCRGASEPSRVSTYSQQQVTDSRTALVGCICRAACPAGGYVTFETIEIVVSGTLQPDVLRTPSASKKNVPVIATVYRTVVVQ